MRWTILALALCLSGCGARGDGDHGDHQGEAPAQDVGTPSSVSTNETGLRFFGPLLITEGDDRHSDFGGGLAWLELDAHELQAIDPGDAYQLAHTRAERVSDDALRRRIMLDLFNETDPIQ